MSATTRIFYYSECITHQNELFPVIYKCYIAHTQSKMKCIFGKSLKSITTILSNLAGSNFFYIFYSFLIFHKKVKQILGTPCFHLWFFFLFLIFWREKRYFLIKPCHMMTLVSIIKVLGHQHAPYSFQTLGAFFWGGNMSSISYQKNINKRKCVMCNKNKNS